MPSSISQSSTGVQACTKPPPPNKPPPPPPKSIRAPPPPPRNSSQLLGQSNVANQLCIPSQGTNGLGILNNGSSMNSLNSAGRCTHVAPSGIAASNSMNFNQRGFLKHSDNYSSRSSVSSHSSSHHHHHAGNFNASSHNNTVLSCLNVCGHQQATNCACSSSIQHNHPNSSSQSDNGSCNLGHVHDNRNFAQMPCTACCSNCNHHHNMPNSKCANQNSMCSTNIRASNSITGQPTSTTIARNTLFCNNDNVGVEPVVNGDPNRNYCSSIHPTHHHHHNMHNIPLSSSSSMSSLQPVDQNSNSFQSHRCNNALPSVTTTNMTNLTSDQIPRPMINSHCHTHKTSGCNHHHQPTILCDHHLSTIQQQQLQQQAIHNCGNCSHSHNATTCNNDIVMGEPNIPNLHHHYQQDLLAASRSPDASNNDSLLSTAHTHNLSNSSTTTHTSNVAVKHQPQFHKPALSRDGRSNSSQHYDQYGLSSAASTSSATASLSSYQMPAGFEDLVPLYPSHKMHQPLPPPPTKSKPPSQMFIHDTSAPMITTTFMNTSQTQTNPPFNSLPPLPPKPISPIASSSSTQITTLRTSPSLQNQPITRVTSQAGVQNPLPNSDVPPPLPPSNPGSRNQPLVNSFMTRNQNFNEAPTMGNPIPDFMNLNLNALRTNVTTEAERKTEELTRQIELELEQQQKSGEAHGICPKCGNKVMPAQEACKAMNQIYHACCFVCCECNRTLLGKTFYPVGDKVYCEEDFKYTGHMQSLEKCAACTQPILDMILPAMGKSYHPKCFKCCICSQCLDGVPFTIDKKNKIYCVKDYHSIYSPKCAACGKSISPIDGTGETVRVVSMEKDYHIDCYCCEDCGLQLTDEEPSQSYPIDNHLLCLQCHLNRAAKIGVALGRLG